MTQETADTPDPVPTDGGSLRAEIDDMDRNDMFWFHAKVISDLPEDLDLLQLVGIVKEAKRLARFASHEMISSGQEIFTHYRIQRELLPARLGDIVCADLLTAMRARYLELIEQLIREWRATDLSSERYAWLVRLLETYPEDVAGDKTVVAVVSQFYQRHRQLLGPWYRRKFAELTLDATQEEIAKDFELHEDDFDFRAKVKYEHLLDQYLRKIADAFPYNINAPRPSREDPRFANLFEPDFVRRLKTDMKQWNLFFALMFVEKIVTNAGTEGAYETMYGRIDYANTPGDFGGGDRSAYEKRRYLHNWWRLEIVMFDYLPELLADALAARYVQVHMDTIRAVANVMEIVFQDWNLPGNRTAYEYRELRAVLRKGVVSLSIFTTIRRLVEDPEISIKRPERFDDLVHMLALLQTESAKDCFKLLFDQLEAWSVHDFYRQDYDVALLNQMMKFIGYETKRMRWFEPHVPYMAFDLLTYIIATIETVEFDCQRATITDTRVIEALDAIRRSSVADLMGWLIWEQPTSRSYVVSGSIHLGGLLIEYARAGVYIGPDQDLIKLEDHEIAQRLKDSDPVAESILVVMIWLGTLVEANSFDANVRIWDSEVVDDLYDVFRLREPSGTTGFMQPQPARYFEVALQVVRQLAHMLDADEVVKYVLRPFATIAKKPTTALDFYCDTHQETAVTQEMIVYLGAIVDEIGPRIGEERLQRIKTVLADLRWLKHCRAAS